MSRTIFVLLRQFSLCRFSKKKPGMNFSKERKLAGPNYLAKGAQELLRILLRTTRTHTQWLELQRSMIIGRYPKGLLERAEIDLLLSVIFECGQE